MDRENQYGMKSDYWKTHNYDKLYFDDLVQVNVSPRSVLYSLEPIGIGTPYVESFTSYINRLAVKHQISVYNLLVIFRNTLNKKSYENAAKVFSFFAKCGPINVVGSRSADFIKGFNALTTRKDLMHLTLLPWQNVLSQRNLIRRKKAFCPYCYEAQKNCGLEIYDPLIWSINIINICPIHKVKIELNCSNKDCKQSQFYLYSNSMIGYCYKCREWLGKPLKDRELLSDSHEFNIQMWNINQIQELIIGTTRLSSIPRRENIASALNLIKRKYFDDTTLHFSNFMNISNDVTRFWFSGKTLPNIEYLLYICIKLNLSFVDLIRAGKVIEKEANVLIPANYYLHFKNHLYNKSKSPVKVIEYELRSNLEAIIESDEIPPPALILVAKRLGVHVNVLYRRFPELSEKISRKSLEYRESEKDKKLESLYQHVKIVTKELIEQGQYPSYHKIEERLQKSQIFRSRKLKEARSEAIDEIDFDNLNM